MSRCVRCKKHYREPADEQGDHDCPHCGLTPEHRSHFRRTASGWVDDYWDEAYPDDEE